MGTHRRLYRWERVSVLPIAAGRTSAAHRPVVPYRSTSLLQRELFAQIERSAPAGEGATEDRCESPSGNAMSRISSSSVSHPVRRDTRPDLCFSELATQ
jgi:hypothetical protein